MARSALRSLAIWMNGERVGQWQHMRGKDVLTYDASWLSHAQGRPLSLSLPFLPGNAPHSGPLVTSYFDNLLPDSEAIRRRIAARYQTSGLEPFALLSAIGRDCVGAIQLLPEGEQPDDIYQIRGEALQEADIAHILRETITGSPWPAKAGASDALRLSIAGAQEKTALLWHQGGWQRPLGSTPTTHIFKLPMGLVGGMQADMRTSVENEWLCSKLIAAFGLAIADCDIASFEEQKALIVRRFDRRPASDGRWLVRLPQEDMCQATGTPPHLKYQSDGGPGISDIMGVLANSATAREDRAAFFKAQILFWLLAATDGHAKNFSITHLPHNQFRATPLYDVLSAHPIIGSGKNQLARQDAALAMAVRGSSNYYKLDRIQRRHWIKHANTCGLSKAEADHIVQDLLDTAPKVLDQLAAQLPANFPADLADAIFNGIRRQRDRLAAMADV